MIENITFKEDVEGKKTFTLKLTRNALISVKAVVRPVQAGFAEYGITLLNNSTPVFSAPISQRLSLFTTNVIRIQKGELTLSVETKEKKTVYLELTVREI